MRFFRRLLVLLLVCVHRLRRQRATSTGRTAARDDDLLNRLPRDQSVVIFRANGPNHGTGSRNPPSAPFHCTRAVSRRFRLLAASLSLRLPVTADGSALSTRTKSTPASILRRLSLFLPFLLAFRSTSSHVVLPVLRPCRLRVSLVCFAFRVDLVRLVGHADLDRRALFALLVVAHPRSPGFVVTVESVDRVFGL